MSGNGQKYNISDNTWSYLPPLPKGIPRKYGFVATSYSNKFIFVFQLPDEPMQPGRGANILFVCTLDLVKEEWSAC